MEGGRIGLHPPASDRSNAPSVSNSPRSMFCARSHVRRRASSRPAWAANVGNSPALPRWADLFLLPAVCLAVALLAAAGVVALVGQKPFEVISVMVHGAFGTQRGLSYTFYYATTFVFTGLAVAVAFHGGLFNIGGEGQAIMGGLGTGLAALWLSASLPAWVMLPVMMLAGAFFGMVWAAVPAYLQAYRGSHVVITTIIFNFMASSLLVYLLVDHLRPAGTMSVESSAFAPSRPAASWPRRCMAPATSRRASNCSRRWAMAPFPSRLRRSSCRAPPRRCRPNCCGTPWV